MDLNHHYHQFLQPISHQSQQQLQQSQQHLIQHPLTLSQSIHPNPPLTLSQSIHPNSPLTLSQSILPNPPITLSPSINPNPPLTLTQSIHSNPPPILSQTIHTNHPLTLSQSVHSNPPLTPQSIHSNPHPPQQQILHLHHNVLQQPVQRIFENHEEHFSVERNCKRKVVDHDIQTKILLCMRDGVDSAEVIMQKFKIDRETYDEISGYKSKLTSSDGLNEIKKIKSVSSPEESIDAATYKWYLQMKARGMTIHGSDIQKAAETVAEHLKQKDFQATTEWLLKFHNTYNLTNNNKCKESQRNKCEVSGETDLVISNLMSTIEELCVDDSQIYNADETNLYWKAMPENTNALTHLPVAEINKQRLTALICCNADGSHKLKPFILGCLKNRRTMRNASVDVPVTYKSIASAQMTRTVFSDWFHYSFVPSVRQYQQTIMNVEAENVRALLVLDSAPFHPNDNYLQSHDGHIKAYLLPNTASKLQPMEQGITKTCKRFYRKYQLDDCLVFNTTKIVQNKPTMNFLESSSNLRTYSIKDAMLNWHRAWNDMPAKSIRRGWSRILQKKDISIDNIFEGLKYSDFLQLLHVAGDENTSLDNVKQWLNMDSLDILQDDRLDAEGSVEMNGISMNTNVMCEVDCILNDEESLEKQKSINLPEAKAAMDHVIRIIDNPRFPKMHKYFDAAKEIRSKITESIISSSQDYAGTSYGLSNKEQLNYRTSGSYGSRNRLLMPKSCPLGQLHFFYDKKITIYT